MKNNLGRIIFAVVDLALLTVVVWWLLQPPARPTVKQRRSAACSLTLVQQVKQADVIVSGRVEVVIPGQPGQAQVIIQPEKVYRGSITSPTISVMALDSAGQDFSTAGTGSLLFKSQDPPYLFYLRQGTDGRYITSACDGTRLFDSGPTPDETALFANLTNS